MQQKQLELTERQRLQDVRRIVRADKRRGAGGLLVDAGRVSPGDRHAGASLWRGKENQEKGKGGAPSEHAPTNGGDAKNETR